MIRNNMHKKIINLQIITSLLLVAVVGKLGYSQIIKHNKLLNLASDLWERSFPIEASRGYIYDRNNKLIATNVPVMSVVVIPYQIKDKEKTALYLSTILNVSKDIIYNKISKRASIIRISPEGRQISVEQANKINDLNIEGVYLVQDSKRYYPYDNLLSHTLGFVGIDNQGLGGIEKYYNDILQGKNGTLNYIMDAKGGIFGNYESRLEAPIAGLSLQLTIDLDIQLTLERELNNAFIKYNPESILGIAMNPNTGEILGIANYPNFNPNNYKDYQQEIINRNLVVWKSYEPGSTFKVFSFAAALEEKVIDMYKDTYYDKGYEIIGGRRIKSWKKGGHGLQTFLEVLENSSNPGFVEISRRLGNDKLYNYVKDFGFSKKTNIDILGESSGIFFSYENYHELENATTSFGQGISVTPIQLVTAFSSLINGGELLQPYIAKSIIHSGTNDVLVSNSKVVKKQVISKQTSDLMKIALESVVANGSGRNAYIDGYRVGGKTGTAQKANNGVYLDGNYILSFIGAAPMNDPQIVVYVAIDNPKNTVQYGGTVAAPIVRNILIDALNHLKVEKQINQLEKEYTWMDTKTYVVENYIGKSKKEVKSKYFKFVFQGEGDKVVDQLPRVGERIEEGSTIVIMLN